MTKPLTLVLLFGLLLIAFGHEPTLAQPPSPTSPFTSPIIGANVDMGIVLPGSKNYVRTPRGDLFDIAKALRLNTLRITNFETWGKGEPDEPYTAADWRSVAARAKATGIKLIPLLGLPKGYIQEIDRQRGLTAPTVETYTLAFRQLTDVILGDAGLAHDGSLSMIDLSNEAFIQSPVIHQTLRNLYRYVHERYPGVLVTVGGYKTLQDNVGQTSLGDAGFQNAGVQTDGKFIQGRPSDGAGAIDCEDVVSVHIYVDFQGGRYPSLQSMPPQAAVASVVDSLREISAWSQAKPILVEEFGAASGLQPLTPQHQMLSPYASPASQKETIGAVIRGIVESRRAGVNVIGGLVWVLAPRGGPEGYGTEANEKSIVLPQGPDREPTILPGAYEIYAGLASLFAQR